MLVYYNAELIKKNINIYTEYATVNKTYFIIRFVSIF